MRTLITLILDQIIPGIGTEIYVPLKERQKEAKQKKGRKDNKEERKEGKERGKKHPSY